jgi:hypothetical protein
MFSVYLRASLLGAAVGVFVGIIPAKAATVTDLITFTDVGTYAVLGDPIHGYQGTATATGSFDITFDPTQQYLTQSITGIITGLTYSITDPFFSLSPLPLNTITQFAFDGSGTLTLYSDAALPGNGKAIVGTPDITIGINGWAYGDASGVWYSQDRYGYTLTASGEATITELPGVGDSLETPLPAALPLFATGLGGLGLLGWRRKRKAAAAIAA